MTGVTEGTRAGGEVKRNVYEDGQVLSAAALRRESEYFLARDRQHTVLCHISGILLGLRVVADGGEFFVERGAAVDDFGRLIVVPVREPITPAYATSPVLLDSGIHQVELLYDLYRSGSNGKDPCTDTHNETLQEGYRLRITSNISSLKRRATNLDPPPDTPNAEASIVLGTIHWDKSSRAYSDPSDSGRLYAGVVGDLVAGAGGTAALLLPDEEGKLSLRMAATDTPAVPSSLTVDDELLTVQRDGSIWAKGKVSAGAGGLHVRPDEDHPSGSWSISLHHDAAGKAFDPAAGDSSDPGEMELRVVFAGESTPTGKRRVVIGTGEGSGFTPAVVVYDGGENLQSIAVEVKGDLYVRGTLTLNKVTKQSSGEDEFLTILGQLFGPLAEVVRTFMLSNKDWLRDVFAALDDDFRQDLADRMNTARLRSYLATEIVDAGLKDDVVRLVVRSFIENDDTLTQLCERLTGNPAFLAKLERELVSRESITQKLADDLSQASARASRVVKLCAALHDKCPPKFGGNKD